jgi:hypothetical protein
MALSIKDKRGVALIVFAIGVMAAIVVAKLALGNSPKAGPDGCIGAVTANTVIVLDHSEALTDQTRHEIVARALAHVRDKTETNERVTVFKVSELSKKSLEPAFSRCKPAQEGNRVVEDVRGIEKGYKRKFLEPLQAALNVAPSNAKESPIAQAIIDVSLTQYLRGERNSLLVFSDLLEYTPKFSLYSCSNADRVVGQFRESRKGAQERPKFINTSVSLNLIPRMDVAKGTLTCRDRLWPWFVGDSEGKGAKVDLDYLPGA